MTKKPRPTYDYHFSSCRTRRIAITTTSLIGQYASAENQNVSSVNVTSVDILYNLTIGEKAYPVLFIIRGDVLDDMSIDGDQAILSVSINASENGGG
jgi:hypothetical protein